MTRSNASAAVLSAFAIACGTGPVSLEREAVRAGATAQGLGIEAYRIEGEGSSRQIHLIAKDDRDVGTIELRQLEAGEIGVNGDPLTEPMLAREPHVRVWFHGAYVDREVATMRGLQRPGIECPYDWPAPTVLPIEPWAAALADPALAPALAELELVVEPSRDAERPIAADRPYNHDCVGHNTNHPSGYDYTGCYAPSSTPHQIVYWYNLSDHRYWGSSDRDCYGSTDEGGNGHLYFGWQSCCNSDCSNPSPAGASTKTDCAGFGGAGCGNVVNNFYCSPDWCTSGAGYDDCGNYNLDCVCNSGFKATPNSACMICFYDWYYYCSEGPSTSEECAHAWVACGFPS